MKRFALLCAVLLLSGGCSGSIFDESRTELDVEFAVTRVNLGNYLERPRVTLTGGAREIVVEGLLSAPSPCQSLSASADGGRTIHLAVRVEPVGQACVAAIGNFEYRAQLRNLSPGTYAVRLEHLWAGSGWPVDRQEHQVTVN